MARRSAVRAVTARCPSRLRRPRLGPAVTLAIAVALLAAPAPAPAAERSSIDRPDDFPPRTQQIHVMYVVAADGTDRQYDVSGAIETSVGAAQAWMAGQTGGKAFRLDTSGGVLDITFIRLASTDAALAARGLYVRDQLESELRARGFADPFKLYGVFYDGTARDVCGGASWPPSKTGHLMAMYLQGQYSDPAFLDCDQNPFAVAGGAPGYRELSFLHELIHTTGSVPSCAPHFGAAGHTNDNPGDLMYAGSAPWVPTALDPGHDDYFGHGRPDCLDLARSGYLAGNPTVPLPGERLPPIVPVDVTAPALTLRAPGSRRLARTVPVRISCADESCDVVVAATVRIGATRTLRLPRVTKRIGRATTATAALRINATPRAEIGRALRRNRRVTIDLAVTATDDAGNSRVARRQIRLRR